MTDTATAPITVKIFSRWDADKILYEATPPASMADEDKSILLGWAIRNALRSGADLRNTDLSGAYLRNTDLSGAYLRGADLRNTDLSGAYLRNTDLRNTDLSNTDLRGADLRGADLRNTDLSGAYLRGADLRNTDLSGAYLRGADLSGAHLKIPTLENIDAKILAAIETAGNMLNMRDWHTCRTTHCRAGWAIHLCGDAGYSLEAKIGSCAAGALIYAKSRPDKRVPDFDASNDDALADMRACAAEGV